MDERRMVDDSEGPGPTSGFARRIEGNVSDDSDRSVWPNEMCSTSAKSVAAELCCSENTLRSLPSGAARLSLVAPGTWRGEGTPRMSADRPAEGSGPDNGLWRRSEGATLLVSNNPSTSSTVSSKLSSSTALSGCIMNVAGPSFARGFAHEMPLFSTVSSSSESGSDLHSQSHEVQQR